MKPWLLKSAHAFLISAMLFARTPIQGSESTSTAATAINAFGIDLLRHTGKPDANALLSPYSIQSALAMAYAGADGVTREEMAKVLHYPKDEAELHSSFSALRKALEKAAQDSVKESEEVRRHGYTNDPLTLTAANRLFGQSGYDFKQPFLNLVKESYDAPFEPLDFVHDAAPATKRINDWVEDKTRQRIRNLIPDGALDQWTRLVLVNAIYLKAPWQEKFEPSATKPEPFHLDAHKSIEVPMMTQTKEWSYGRGNGFSALQLPYWGYSISLLIFLPDSVDGLASLEAKLNLNVFSGSVTWEPREVKLFMPKFKLEPPLLPLSGALKALGMKTAFDIPQRSANFDRIAPRRPDDYLALKEAYHKTFLKLDEEGTEAAAATALVAITAGIHEPPKPVTMKVDHPFLFAVQHQASGACLFLGRVTDPR
jgi:serpin B